MSASQARHDQMIARLDAYATARDAGGTPAEAIAGIGLAPSASMRYERWYRVGRQGMPVRSRADGLVSFGNRGGIGSWPKR